MSLSFVSLKSSGKFPLECKGWVRSQEKGGGMGDEDRAIRQGPDQGRHWCLGSLEGYGATEYF